MPTPDPPPPAADPDRREATARALIVGGAIGLVLAAGNVYTGLKTGFIDGGSITAALFGFVLFSSVKGLARRRYGPLENNITQTTAASAAIMGFVVGLPGPVPALGFLGVNPPGWAMALWGLAAGVLGIAAAIVLRKKLIVDDALPFPTGRATAEVIETIYTARAAAMRRALLLAVTAAVAVAVTWLRDGVPKIIPQATPFGGSIAGIAAASLTIGMSWSPLLMSTGGIIGPRGGASVLLGGATSWVVLAPILLKAGIVAEPSFGPLTSWLVWPALGLMVAGSFAPLLLDFGAIRRSFRDLGALARGAAPGSPAPGSGRDAVRSPALAALFAAAVLTLVVVGRAVFGVGPGVTLILVVMALVLTNVSARATGETDVAPVGAVGMLTLGAFARAGAIASLVAGWVSSASSSQASQTMYAFRVGDRLGASTRAQVGAQLVGALLGAVIVVPVYFLIVKSYGLGTEALPAAAAQSWKAMVVAARGNASAFPPCGLMAGALGLAAGAALVIGARTRLGRFLPSPAAMGMAMLIPASYSLAIFVGAIAVAIARRMRPDLDESTILTAAAGGMAGESLTGVLVAALTGAGVL